MSEKSFEYKRRKTFCRYRVCGAWVWLNIHVKRKHGTIRILDNQIKLHVYWQFWKVNDWFFIVKVCDIFDFKTKIAIRQNEIVSSCNRQFDRQFLKAANIKFAKVVYFWWCATTHIIPFQWLDTRKGFHTSGISKRHHTPIFQ